MKFSGTYLQFIAAMATNRVATPSRSSYRGARKNWGRGFSGRPYNEGRGQLGVTGDAHFQSVRDSNFGIRQAGGAAFNPQHRLPRPPRYNPNQQLRQPPPFVQNQNPAIRPPQQFRPRPPKPLDYRDWEYTKRAPPPDSQKFIVLSYNILADYLAFSHRSKLYFHIPRHMLDWEWRKRNILFELSLWSADIMCFQEVDRYQDLAEELKIRGYDGIWKMRTGNAFDGCAIFWRTSRFKLLYEESIEFNKLGLRDNVAQICVLELVNKSCTADTMDFPSSPASSDKVVICNIHVLYNPKRGEIKLGQVRTLLDKAYAVSQMWNAPVVLCGDFNCIPKSPLYNFISEQKLDLSGIDRDKVSGQASAEIRAPRPYNSNPNPNLNASPNWARSFDDSNQASVFGNSLSDMQMQDNPEKNENIPTTDKSTRTILDVSDVSFSVIQCGKVETAMCAEETKQTKQDVIDNCEECTDKEGDESTIPVLIHGFEEKLTISHSESELPVRQMNELIRKSTPTVTSQTEDTHPDENQMRQARSASPPDQVLFCEHSHSNIDTENKGPSNDNLAQSLGVSSLESFRYLSSQPIVNDDNADLSAACQANISCMSTSIYLEGDKKLDDASAQQINDFPLEGERIGEDQDAFLSALHNTKDSFQPDFGQIGQSDLAGSQNEFASDSIDSEVNSPSIEVLDDLSPDLDSDYVTVDKTAYNPSLWTPMEIATATGNADCIFLEHPLKLKSTYAEVEDCSGTRDPNGEPLVTSYNRCFSGTVDYIWSSEGLQTVRVLAPIPKHAMQWTPGFPTKKWGSDHIALASELALTKDATDKHMEVQPHKD